MKTNRFVLLVIISFLLSGILPLSAQDTTVSCPSGNPNLVITTGAVGQDLPLLNRMLANYMILCPNVTVRAFEAPDLVKDRLGLYNQFFASKSTAVDIYSVDVIWPGIFAEHMVDLYEYIPADSETITQHFPSTIQNNTINSRLIGLPWYIDAGILYYRKDLLEKYGLSIPKTWDELETAAQTIQDGERASGNSEFWGYIWQGNNGEPTMVNGLEWQASNGGGTILSLEGEVQVNNPETIAAIERAADWIGTISPSTVIGHKPADTNNIWQAGNAAFMRNWLFSYAISEQNALLAGNFDATLLPAGEGQEAVATLGGYQLGVSQYSNNKEAAVQLVLYLTSYEGQKFRALEAGYAPTIQTLYQDPDLIAASPLFASVQEVFQHTVARPSSLTGARYSEVSTLYSDAVHSVLEGRNDARTAMEDLEFDLEDLVAEILDS